MKLPTCSSEWKITENPIESVFEKVEEMFTVNNNLINFGDLVFRLAKSKLIIHS